MKLDAARLCLDCEEIHEAQICPICSSEAFAYLTRWVQPAVDRPKVRSAPEPQIDATAPQGRTRTPEQIDAYRQLLEGKPRRRAGLVTGSVLGLAAVSLAGWAIRSSARKRTTEGDAPAPETKPRSDPE